MSTPKHKCLLYVPYIFALYPYNYMCLIQSKQIKRLADALNALLSGESTVKEVNATADSVLTRVDGLIDDYAALFHLHLDNLKMTS